MFNAIALQLIHAPESSRAALAAAAAGRPPEPLPRAAGALLTAAQWLGLLLRTPFAPGATVPLLAFPMEEGCCDVVRASWTAGDVAIDTAQTRSMVAIAFTGFHPETGEDAAAFAGRVAATVFAAPDARFVFTSSGSNEAGIIGPRDFATVGTHGGVWANWIDAMWFWSDGTTIGFLTIREYGGPAQAVSASPDEGSNRTWFDPKP
jgi:hypothetical protein